MGEIRDLKKKQQQKALERLGAKSTEDGVTIIGGVPTTISGNVEVMDKNSPVGKQQVEVHIHADRKSYDEALKKDQ